MVYTWSDNPSRGFQLASLQSVTQGIPDWLWFWIQSSQVLHVVCAVYRSLASLPNYKVLSQDPIGSCCRPPSMLLRAAAIAQSAFLNHPSHGLQLLSTPILGANSVSVHHSGVTSFMLHQSLPELGWGTMLQ